MKVDLVFKNWTSPRPRRGKAEGGQKAPRGKFFKNIIEKGCDILKLKENLELSVNIVAEAKMKSLNKKYRNKDKPTDVLSFPMLNGNGDIFICLSIAKKEAKRENISVEAKLAQLTVHGFLHLQGYDHENSKREAEKMFGLENKILNKV